MPKRLGIESRLCGRSIGGRIVRRWSARCLSLCVAIWIKPLSWATDLLAGSTSSISKPEASADPLSEVLAVFVTGLCHRWR